MIFPRFPDQQIKDQMSQSSTTTISSYLILMEPQKQMLEPLPQKLLESEDPEEDKSMDTSNLTTKFLDG